MRIRAIRKTCIASPARWDGDMDDGRFVCIRYRAGILTVCFGATPDEAADDRPEREWFARQVGGQWADNILFDEICRVTNLVPPRGLDREAIDEVGG
jgi:hypothetical protein